MKKGGMIVGSLSIAVLVGCANGGAPVDDVVTPAEDIANKVGTQKMAEDAITKAVEEKDAALGEAMKAADEAIAAAQDDAKTEVAEMMKKPEEANTINDNKMDDAMKAEFPNVPEQIDMSLAASCGGATVTTNNGVVELEFYGDKAPIAVSNFCTLAKKGFYDGVIFHRVIRDFMIQGGDPDGIGTGGPDYKFEDELPEAGEYKMGSLAMANAGPNTNGSQFFIVSGANGVGLPPLYTLFGQVTEGLDVVEKIQTTETGMRDKPTVDVVIESIVLKMK